MNDEFLAEVLPAFEKLESLDVSGTEVTDASLKTILAVKDCSSLDIGGTQITAAVLPAVAESTGLTRLGISHLVLTAEHLRQLAPLTKLTQLEFDTTKFDDDMAEQLAKFQQLEELRCWDSRLTARGLNAIGTLSNLKTLQLGGGRYTGRSLAALANLKSLTSLSLGQTIIRDDDLAHLSGLKQLTSLEIDTRFLTDAGLRHLGEFENVGYLQLTGEFGPDGLRHLAGMKSLDTLQVTHARLAPGGLGALASLPGLRSLFLYRVAFDGGDFTAWADAPLKDLSIDACAIEGSLAPLAGLKELRSLSCSNIDLDDAAVNQLLTSEGWSALEQLELGYLPIDGSGLAGLAKLGALRELTIRDCLLNDAGLAKLDAPAVTELDLTGNDFTSAGVGSLSRLPKIEWLTLSNNRLDDSAVPLLLKCEQLDLLDVTQTDISVAGQERLREALPTASIYGDAEDE
ncbi:MAG: hypothetical protein R3B90_06310 [Planctomycetaceae bacterium]